MKLSQIGNLVQLFTEKPVENISPILVTPKPASKSLSFKSASVATVLGLWLAISPSVGGLLQSRANTTEDKEQIGYVIDIVNQIVTFLIVGTGVTGVAGVIQRRDIYTPEGVVGKSASDFESNERQ